MFLSFSPLSSSCSSSNYFIPKYAYLFIIIQIISIPEIYAKTPNFIAPTPTPSLFHEVSSGTATLSQFQELTHLAQKNAVLRETAKEIESLENMLDQEFRTWGEFGEKKTGQIVLDWDSFVQKAGFTKISEEKAKEVYNTWRQKTQKRVSPIIEGSEWSEKESEKTMDKFLTTHFDPESTIDGQQKNGKTLITKKDWEDFANGTGLPGAGLLLMTIYQLWRKRKKTLKIPVPDFKIAEKDYDAFQGVYEEAFDNTKKERLLDTVFRKELFKIAIQSKETLWEKVKNLAKTVVNKITTKVTESLNFFKDLRKNFEKNYRWRIRTAWYFWQGRIRSIQKEKAYIYKKNIEEKTYLEKLKELGVAIKTRIQKETQSKKTDFHKVITQTLQDSSLEKIATNIQEKTNFNASLKNITKNDNPALYFIKTNLQNSDTISTYQNIQTYQKELKILKDSHQKIINKQTPAQTRIQELKQNLNKRNAFTWEEKLDQNPALKKAYYSSPYSHYWKKDWANASRYVGQGSDKHRSRYANVLHNIAKYRRTDNSVGIASLTELARKAHEESMHAYREWPKYFYEHPLLWKKKQKNWETELKHLTMLETQKKKFLSKNIQSLEKNISDQTDKLWTEYKDKKSQKLISKTIPNQVKNQVQNQISAEVETSLIKTNHELLKMELENKKDNFTKQKVSLSFEENVHYKALSNMIRSMKRYASSAGIARTSMLTNAKNESIASAFSAKIAQTHGITTKQYHSMTQKQRDTKFLANQKATQNTARQQESIRIARIINSPQAKQEESAALAAYAKITYEDESNTKSNIKNAGINFGGETIFQFNQKTAYEQYLKQTKNLTNKEKERIYNKFWDRWKNEDTSVAINVSGFGNYGKTENFSVAPITEDLQNSEVGHNTKVLTLAHQQAGTTLGMSVLNKALANIKSTLGKNGKVVLLGHSFGGDSVVELSKKLQSEGVDVEFLVTVDAVGVGEDKFPFSGFTIIPKNVKNHVNIWEDLPAEPEKIFFGQLPNVSGQHKFGYEGKTKIIENKNIDLNHISILPSPNIQKQLTSLILKTIK